MSPYRGECTVDGVKMIFQNTPHTEAPSEMNTWSLTPYDAGTTAMHPNDAGTTT